MAAKQKLTAIQLRARAEQERRRRQQVADGVGVFEPLSHQQQPATDWRIWAIVGGRGCGKTRAGVEWVRARLHEQGATARIGIMGRTDTNVRDVCAEGESGLITLYGNEFDYNRSGGRTEARHIKGGYVRFMGADKHDNWNGPQWNALWCDELALCTKAAWDMANLGLRLEPHPRAIITTTPKTASWVRKILEADYAVTTHGRTIDNPYLDDMSKSIFYDTYGGTQLGRQELDGQWIDELEGAMWRRGWINAARVQQAPALQRVVIAVDPAVTSNKQSDETGIAAVGVGEDGDYYVLKSTGLRVSPNQWAATAADWYHDLQANMIVAERNNGGEMVTATLLQADAGLPVKTIHASRGKTVRAEPVALLYEQGRVHHVGLFPELEDQLCEFPIAHEHDDRLDAMVYAVSYLTQSKQFNMSKVDLSGLSDLSVASGLLD